jgi:hypothetical protein
MTRERVRKARGTQTVEGLMVESGTQESVSPSLARAGDPMEDPGEETGTVRIKKMPSGCRT